mmetsp:Transcript_26686/g.51748  ORF Transcript_26686/g.51748 Transcript_26686/m.51748 type:complete len:206 (-) Transcript_26686:47-664(-)
MPLMICALGSFRRCRSRVDTRVQPTGTGRPVSESGGNRNVRAMLCPPPRMALDSSFTVPPLSEASLTSLSCRKCRASVLFSARSSRRPGSLTWCPAFFVSSMNLSGVSPSLALTEFIPEVAFAEFPPNLSFFSSSSTSADDSAAVIAAVSPAKPEPITTTLGFLFVSHTDVTSILCGTTVEALASPPLKCRIAVGTARCLGREST